MTEPLHFENVSLPVSDVERSLASHGSERRATNREEEVR